MNLFISNFKKQFLFSIIILLIIYVFTIILVEMYALKTIKAQRNSQFEELIDKGHQYNVGLLGTSHTNYGNALNDDSKIFYYGQSGTFFVEMYYKSLKFIEHAKNMKVVLIEVDDIQFTKKAAKRRDKNYSYLYKDSIEIPKDYIYTNNTDVRPIIHKELLKSLFNLPINKIKNNDNYRIINNKVFKYEDWSEQDKDKRKKDSIKRLKSYNLNYDYKIPNKLLVYLERTIQVLKKNDIKVVFIKHPQANEYFQYMNKKLQQRIYDKINLLSKKHNIKVLDYRYIFEENQNLFFNQDHLNADGWVEFLEILYKDLENEL